MDQRNDVSASGPDRRPDDDRVFWLAIREALLLILRAIEKRHLPALAKRLDKGAGPVVR